MDESDYGSFTASLQAALPVGWFAKESITLIGPDGQGNVIASSEPLDPTIDSARYARIQGDLLRNEFPGYTEYRFETCGAFGLDGYIREFSWRPPDGVPVTQIQVYATVPGRGYTATATTSATQANRFREQFLKMIASLRIDHTSQPHRRSRSTCPGR